MNDPDFYLASTDYYYPTNPRRVWRIKRMSSPHRKDLLLARVDPPIKIRHGERVERIGVVLLATRHVGATLFPVSEWPVFVHVARVLMHDAENHDTLQDKESESIGWAELYRTEKDARNSQIPPR